MSFPPFDDQFYEQTDNGSYRGDKQNTYPYGEEIDWFHHVLPNTQMALVHSVVALNLACTVHRTCRVVSLTRRYDQPDRAY